jgi:hypothetical protein
VAQIDQQSATLIDRLGDQDVSINDLAKTVARGVPAMRDASENVLELNPNATIPLLTSRRNDVGQSYVTGLLQVVDKTGQEWRDLSAGVITGGGGATELNYGGIETQAITVRDYLSAANGVYSTTSSASDAYADRFHAGGCLMDSVGIAIGPSTLTAVDMGAPGLFGYDVTTLRGRVVEHWTCGNVHINNGGISGPAASFGGVNVNGGGVDTQGRNMWCWGLYAQGVQAAGGSFNVIAWGATAAWSDRRLKHDIVDVDRSEALGHLLALRPREFEWNDHPERGRVRGFVADEMPERFQREIPNPQPDEDDDGEPLGAYDLGEVITTTVTGVQALSAKLDAATETIAALTARLDAALDRVAALEAAA